MFEDSQRDALFKHLIARETPLSGKEMRLLGWDLSALISDWREYVRVTHFQSYKPLFRMSQLLNYDQNPHYSAFLALAGKYSS